MELCFRGRLLASDESAFDHLRVGEELAAKAARIHRFGEPDSRGKRVVALLHWPMWLIARSIGESR